MDGYFRFSDGDFRFHHLIDRQPSPSDFYTHFHEMNEIYCFMSGSAKYIVEGRVYTPEPGSLLLMRSNETHCLQILNPEPYERCTLHFLPSLVDGALLRPFYDRQLGELNLYKPSEFAGLKPTDIFAMICDDCELPRHQLMLCGLYALLGAVAPAFERKLNRPHADPGGSARDIIFYINRNLSQNLSIPSICAEFHISESQLSRVFKNATGTSLGNYIRSKRLIAARQLIDAGARAQDACSACGCGDYSSFFRAFRKRFGHAPTRKPDGSLLTPAENSDII